MDKLKDYLDKIAEIKSDMRNILDTAESEKRSLSEDEKNSLETMRDEKTMLELRMSAEESEIKVRKDNEESEFRSKFAIEITNAVKRNERFALDVRATPPIDSTDVADTISILQKDVIYALEPAIVVNKIGLKMQTGVVGQPMWPIIAGVEASILGENIEVSDSTLDFNKITASPKRLSVSIPVSRRAIYQSNLNLYSEVTKQLGLAVARTMNKWLLSAPDAIQTGLVSPFAKGDDIVPFAGDYPTFEEIADLESAVFDANVMPDGFGAYVMSTSMYGKLKSTPIAPNYPSMIIQPDGTINGYPLIVTNQFPQGYVGFGFFSYAVMSEFAGSQVIVDPYTGAKRNLVYFVYNGDFDITLLHPEAFALGKKIE